MKFIAQIPTFAKLQNVIGHFKTTMKQIIYILTFKLLTITNSFGQTETDSVYNIWWTNKDKSIFQTIDNGIFSGTTNGYVQLKNGKDTLVLDFQMSKTTLNVIHDPNEMYDKSTKKYSAQTTSGKTTLTYEVYALANILTINLNGLTYRIGIIDGASDTPIFGLAFNYCSDIATEFLTLFVTKPLELTTTREVMKQRNIDYLEAQKLAKTITILPGSTLILTVDRKSNV
jgi:hypothetical protein